MLSDCAGVAIHTLPQLSETLEIATVEAFHQTYAISKSFCCGCPEAGHPDATVVLAVFWLLLFPRTKNPASGDAEEGGLTTKVTVMVAGEFCAPAAVTVMWPT